MKNNTTRDKLIDALRTVYDNRNFILGVMSYAKKEKHREMILKYIQQGENVNIESVSLLALHLSQEDAREQ